MNSHTSRTGALLMDDLARVRFDSASATRKRAAALNRLTVLEAGRWHPPVGGRPGARFIAVRGGAGVGKSTVAANLAIALAGLRSRVVLIDLDLRHPTQHELFGIATPIRGLKALLQEQIETMEQALTATSVRNLHLVSGEGTTLHAGSAAVEQQQRLLSQIWEMDADVVIADVGASTEGELVDLFEMGAMRLVVATPEPRSIRRAYNCCKEQVVREVDHVSGGTGEGALLLAALNGPHPPPMTALLERVNGKPNVRAALDLALQSFTGRLIGNRIRNSVEADLVHATSRLMLEYLGIAVPVLGVLDSSLQVDATRVSGRPLLLGSGIDRNVRLFHSMAEQLLMDGEEAEAPRCVTHSAATLSCATPRSSVIPDPDGAHLPVSLGSYMRRHPRHPVDWHAVYRRNPSKVGKADGAGNTDTPEPDRPVRLFEISCSGASITTLPGLEVGEEGLLIFTQIPGQPQVRVTVMDARRPLGRAGLQFPDSDETCARLAALAARRGG